MSSIRLKPDELDLLARLIDRRDSAHLAGITTDPFYALELNGGVSVLACPGRTGREQVATFTIRLRSVGLFQVNSENKNTLTFDLVDDVRDQLELLREAAGQPSLVGQERAARANAEDQLSRLQVNVEVDAGERERGARRRRGGSADGRSESRSLDSWRSISWQLRSWRSPRRSSSLASSPRACLASSASCRGHSTSTPSLPPYWVETRVAGRFRRWLDSFETDEHG